MSFLSAITVTNRKSLATVRLWAQHGSRSLVFERMAWANARSHASLHAVAARGRLFKSFRMALGFIWEQEITGVCMLNHLVRRNLRGIAKQRMFILQVILFSQLRQWHMHIHRTYTSTVYCSYDYVHCKQSVYLSSFSFLFIYFYFLVCYGDELKMTWTTPTPSSQLVSQSRSCYCFHSIGCQVDTFNHCWEVVRVIMIA